MAENRRLFIVDDNPDMTDLIGEIGRDESFDVFTLNDSTEFFAEFGRIDPQVVCIDIHMPDVDGIEIVRWLGGADCRASVIILSGGDPLFATVAQRIAAASKLRVSTVSKPFRVADIRSALRRASAEPGTA
tara:strand:+ start:930 stop:1322 length:393 start_codon:yes stop_codon:yes gene_type:complete